MLLAGPDGGRAGLRYAAGVVLTTFVIVVALVLFGRAISLPTKPHLDASLDLVVGLVLVFVAVLVLVLGRRRSGSPSREGGDDGRASDSHQARAAFPFGVFSMATNVTTLALLAAAAKEISRTDAEIAAATVLVLVLVGLVTTPAWVPVALTRVAPGPSQRGLAALREQIARRGRGSPSGCSAPPGCSSSDAGSSGCSADERRRSCRSATASRAASRRTRLTPQSVSCRRMDGRARDRRPPFLWWPVAGIVALEDGRHDLEPVTPGHRAPHPASGSRHRRPGGPRRSPPRSRRTLSRRSSPTSSTPSAMSPALAAAAQ